MIHHPPLPGQAKPRRALTDADRLSEVLRAAGVELVLHGHNHRDMVATFTTVAGPALISGIASGSMAGGGRHPSARYAVHRISRTGSGWHVVTERRGLGPDGTVTSLDTIATELSRDG
jgi:3',5'-cyclic AMP phosphodiesterase CpdA